MAKIRTLIEQAESLIAEKVGKGEFQVKEIKNSASAFIEVEGCQFQVGLDSYRGEIRPIGNERRNLKLNLSPEQSKTAYAEIREEMDRLEFERLNKKYGK